MPIYGVTRSRKRGKRDERMCVLSVATRGSAQGLIGEAASRWSGGWWCFFSAERKATMVSYRKVDADVG